MKTYFYTETPSPLRGFDVRITVWRIKQNTPELVGHSDSQTASWYGARGEAQRIISVHDNIPMEKTVTGGRYLKGLASFTDMYEKSRCSKNAVRVFAV